MFFNNSNKFNRLLLFQIVLFVLIVCQKSNAQERVWVYVGTDNKNTMLGYVDLNTQRQPNGNLYVWEKMIRSDTNIVIGLVEWDCRQKRSRIIQETMYDSYGEPLKMSKNLDWTYTIDGTLGASIYRMVCRNYEKVSRSSTAKTPAGIQLAEITVAAANLREFPNTNSDVIREVKRKERLILSDEKPQGNWYKVLDKESQSEGWLHKSTFKIINSGKSSSKK